MITTPKHTLHLVRKPSTDEWVIVWRTNGRRNEDRTYYTDDKADALATMAHMQLQADALNREERKMEHAKEAVVNESLQCFRELTEYMRNHFSPVNNPHGHTLLCRAYPLCQALEVMENGGKP